MLGITCVIRASASVDDPWQNLHHINIILSSFLLSFSGGLRDLLILGCCETCLFLIWVGLVAMR